MGGSAELRKQVLLDTAAEVMNRETERALDEEILEPEDIAGIFQFAAVMTILRINRVDEELAAGVATECVRMFMRSMSAHHIGLGEF